MDLTQIPVAGANAGRARSHNRQMVLGQVRNAGHLGRAEIARASGLSTQAVSNIIADLQADGMIVQQGKVSLGRGLPAVQYALNPAGGCALGVEIRPDAAFVALLDLTGAPLFSRRLALTDLDLPRITAQIVALRDAALKDTGVAPGTLLGAGVVIPGPFGITGLSKVKSELPNWRDIDAVAWFHNALDVPVFVENDANAAAMSEHISGVARDLNDYAYLYFGAGLGLGIVSGGRVFRGAFGNAGEIGHIPLQSTQGAPLESRVSRLAAQHALSQVGLHAASVDDLTAHFAAREPALMAWIEAAKAPLAEAIAMLENLLDPQAVILGGAMPDAILDHFVTHVPLSDNSVSCRVGRVSPRVLRGASGRLSATLGAAALVLNDVFKPTMSV